MAKVVLRICAGALLASASHQAIAQSADWTVSETRGPVTIVSAQGREAATSGAGVNPGDTVVTGPGGRAVLVHKKDFVTVAANSRIRIPRENAETGITRFFQEVGNAIFNVEKRGKPHFSVDTPFLAAVVKGTVFSVSVNAASTALQVTEGVVEVATTDGGARDLVRPGSIAMIAAGDRYRLTITGDRAATIDSPARASVAEPAAPSTAPAMPVETVPVPSETPGPAPEKMAEGAGETVNVRIEEAVVSKPVDLAKATNGILTGLSPVSFAAEIGLTKAVAETATRGTTLTSAPPALSEKPVEKPEVAKADGKSDASTPTPPTETTTTGGPAKADTGKPADTSTPAKPAENPDAGKPTDKGDGAGPTDTQGNIDTDKSDSGSKGEDKPGTAKPDAGETSVDKPEADKPDAGDKGKDKPDASEPDSGDKGKPDTDKPDAGDKGRDKPEAEKPDAGDKGKDKPEAEKPDASEKGKDKPEADKPDAGDKGKDKPEAEKPDAGDKGKDKPEAEKPDAGDKGKDKPEADKPEAGDKGKDKPDAPKPDGGDKGKPDAGKPDDGGKAMDKPDAGRPGGDAKGKFKFIIDKLIGGLEREIRVKLSKGED